MFATIPTRLPAVLVAIFLVGGSTPSAVAFDEYPDVVTTDLDGLWIFRSDGEGGFHEPEQLFIGVAVEPWHVVTGDVNDDGFTDIVSANRLGPHVTVHIGNGDGTFDEPFFIATNERPYDVDLGDLDGDGLSDLIVTCNNDFGPLEIRFNEGDGEFEEVSFYFTAEDELEPFNSEIADFDADGAMDVAVTMNSTDNMTVLMNEGGGEFDVRGRIAVGDDPKPISSGHVNDDEHLDLILTNYDAGQVSVLLGDGGGEFSLHGSYPAGVLPREVAVVDLDKDGLDDVVIAGGRDTDFVVRYLAAEDGSLTDELILTTGPRPNSVASADFNVDGNPDVVVANWSLDDPSLASMSLLLGAGDGSFSEIANFAPEFGFLKITALATGQFNAFRFLRGDANLDGKVNVSDPIVLLRHVFQGETMLCQDSGDIDDSGELGVTDGVNLLEYLFLSGARPRPPFPKLGLDPTTDSLKCDPLNPE